MSRKLVNYLYALRYLHPYQIFFRIYFYFFKLPRGHATFTRIASPILSNKIKVESSNLASFSKQQFSFKFLNVEKNYPETNINWSDKSMPKLWLYQLHYFDYVHSMKKEDGLRLIRLWIQKNNVGVGREPYATSLRIINWIIFLCNEEINDDEINASLWQQYQELQQKLEYHLLGNHLWENYRAIIFAAIFFDQTKFRQVYESKLRKEFETQILPDGAHAELTPMYQSIMLNGLYELSAFFDMYQIIPELPLKETIDRMANYLANVCHPDGKVAQFNDSAIDFSKTPASLSNMEVSSALFNNSGHARLQKDDLVVIADTGPVAYKYFSGHSHSDNLTFELSYKKRRIIVDPGISTYEESEQRSLERKTEFHNTLIVKGLEQSDTWKSFRLGRRANSQAPNLSKNASVDKLSGKYAFRDNGVDVSHSRVWELESKNLRIQDQAKFSKNTDGYISFNFHSGITLSQLESHSVQILEDNKVIGVLSTNAEEIEISKSFHSPNFGQKFDCQRLLLHFKTVGHLDIITNIYFSA